MAHYKPGTGIDVSLIPFYVENATSIIIDESESPVEIALGEEAVLIQHSESVNWFLTGIGATDNTDSEYWLKVGDDESFHHKEPLGLFNSPFRLDPALLIPAGVVVGYWASLSEESEGAKEYVGKILGYVKET